MELKIPIEVDFDDMKALIDDLGRLQKYKLFEGDEMVLVDVDDVANVLVRHMKAKEAQPDFDITAKIDKAYDRGYEAGYLQAKHDWE